MRAPGGPMASGMSFHILFWTLSMLLVANMAVVVIAIINAYRDEGKSLFSKATSG
jgi:hypothetical protein